MAINDGTVIRPIDEPVTAAIVPDWTACLSDAMSHRVELRRQKWNIKSLELQLAAAKSLTKSRLDFISGYQINAFGNHLLDSSEGSNPPPDSYFHSLAEAETTGWNAGVQMAIPIGFRAQLAQVRNYELRVAKAHKVLAAQELEVGHELAIAMQELDRTYETMRSNYYRFIAAEDDVRLREPRYKNGEELIDTILRAYERRAQAEAEYYRSVVEYNKSLVNLQFRRGTILEYDNVHLMEGYWDPPAYADAERQAWARSFAVEDDAKFHSPPAFSSPFPVDEVRFATPIVPMSEEQESYNPPATTAPTPIDSPEMPAEETAPAAPEAVEP
jgi:outer membrane protein TolC